jgi:hypothetical protein
MGGKGSAVKSFRQEASQSNPYVNKYAKRVGRANEPRSQLSFTEGRAEEIQFLIRKNNYSANALNLKTLNILQQINSKNSRCTSSLKQRGNGKISECLRPTKKNMVAFLRKVAWYYWIIIRFPIIDSKREQIDQACIQVFIPSPPSHCFHRFYSQSKCGSASTTTIEFSSITPAPFSFELETPDAICTSTIRSNF